MGAGPPPVCVPDGFLAIYHGSRHPTRPGEVGTYHGGALLLDTDDPAKVLKCTAEPFMRPEAEFEVSGFVPNVVFPTGVVQDGEHMLVYYGAADAVTAVAEFSLRGLMGDNGRAGLTALQVGDGGQRAPALRTTRSVASRLLGFFP